MPFIHIRSKPASRLLHVKAGTAWQDWGRGDRRKTPLARTALLLAAWCFCIGERCLADETPKASLPSPQATLDAIRNAWQARQNAVRAAEFIWTEKRLHPKGTRTDANGNYGVYPPNDVTVEVPGVVFRFDLGKYYYERVFHLHSDDLSREGRKWIWSHDGVEVRTFMSGSHQDTPHKPRGDINSASSLFGTEFEILAIMLPFRPLAPDGLGIDVDALSVRGRTEIVDNVECVVVDETLTRVKGLSRTYWVDPRRGFVPLRWTFNYQGTPCKTLDLRYIDSVDYGPIPQSWTMTTYRPKTAYLPGGVDDRSEAQVTSWEINGALHASQLTVSFEPGTIIQDRRRDTHLIVLRNGSTRPATNEERAGNWTIEDLATPMPRRTSIVNDSSWGAVILKCIAAAMVVAGVWSLTRTLWAKTTR